MGIFENVGIVVSAVTVALPAKKYNHVQYSISFQYEANGFCLIIFSLDIIRLMRWKEEREREGDREEENISKISKRPICKDSLIVYYSFLSYKMPTFENSLGVYFMDFVDKMKNP